MHPDREVEAEDVAPRRALHDELGGNLGRHREVALAPEDERLQGDRERIAVLLPGAQLERAERETGHGARVTAPSSGKDFVRIAFGFGEAWKPVRQEARFPRRNDR